MLTADTITDEQIRELLKYADREAQLTLLSNCRVALSRDIRHSHRASVHLAREHCAQAYARVVGMPEWDARDLPRDAFATAEMVAQFVLEEAARWEHVEQVHDALVETARKIRTAEWTPEARARCAEILNARGAK
jgi:hypothetical protein